jgi:hypothetical protein
MKPNPYIAEMHNVATYLYHDLAVRATQTSFFDGIFYRMWILGYFIYSQWMQICNIAVILSASVKMLTFQDWTTAVPEGFIGCHQVVSSFL